MFNYLKVTLLLLLTHSTVYSQKPIIVTYNNQTRYCITEDQALLTVSVFDQNEIHKGVILDLELKVDALEEKDVAKDIIIAQTDTIVQVERERTELTKKELRKKNIQAVGTWFKNARDKILFAIGGAALGVGVGLGVSR